MNVGFIGLGKLGLDCAEVFAEKYKVRGYDIYPRTSEMVEVCNIAEVVSKSDWIFIAVPTPHAEGYDGSVPSSHMEPRDFGHDAVKDALKHINRYATSPKRVVLISTVLPGTTRRHFATLLDKQHQFLYNPYLIAMGSVKWDMANPEMVMIGTETGNPNEMRELIDIYRPLMKNNPRYQNFLQHIHFSQSGLGQHDPGLCIEDRQHQCGCGHRCIGPEYHAYHGTKVHDCWYGRCWCLQPT